MTTKIVCVLYKALYNFCIGSMCLTLGILTTVEPVLVDHPSEQGQVVNYWVVVARKRLQCISGTTVGTCTVHVLYSYINHET